MKRQGVWAALLAAVVAACGDSDVTGLDPDGLPPLPGIDAGADAPDEPADAAPVDAPPPDAPPPQFQVGACEGIYAQELFPTFEILISDAEWAEIQGEYDREVQWPAYHPIEFRMGTATAPAHVRLRGNNDNWLFDKMQFQVSFNETDRDARFLGLRKIVLDAAYYNRSLMRDRVAFAFMRHMGVKAPCANHARLLVNGAYYGVYQNIEKVDREFLERNYENPDGDLWKRAAILTTNELTATAERIDRYWDAGDVTELEQMLDIGQAIREWAAEAAIPDADGYWAGGWNYYLYDVPGGRFEFLPWDIDLAFTRLPYTTDPLLWHKTTENYHGRPQYDLVVADPFWFGEYLRALREARDAYDPELLVGWLDAYYEQIADAVAEDPNLPYGFSGFESAVDDMRDYIPDRAAFLDDWLACWEGGGTDVDGDGTCDP